MSIRRQFVLVLAAFAVVLAVAFWWVATAISSQALENELDQRLVAVAGAAAAVNLQGTVAQALQRGDEDLDAWKSYHARLVALLDQVEAAGPVEEPAQEPVEEPIDETQPEEENPESAPQTSDPSLPDGSRVVAPPVETREAPEVLPPIDEEE